MKNKPASSWYRRHVDRPPKEHPVYDFTKWRNYIVKTKEHIGYEQWLEKQLAG